MALYGGRATYPVRVLIRETANHGARIASSGSASRSLAALRVIKSLCPEPLLLSFLASVRPSVFLPAWPPLPAVHEKPTRAVRPATEEGDRGVAASDATPPRRNSPLCRATIGACRSVERRANGF